MRVPKCAIHPSFLQNGWACREDSALAMPDGGRPAERNLAEASPIQQVKLSLDLRILSFYETRFRRGLISAPIGENGAVFTIS